MNETYLILNCSSAYAEVLVMPCIVLVDLVVFMCSVPEGWDEGGFSPAQREPNTLSSREEMELCSSLVTAVTAVSLS